MQTEASTLIEKYLSDDEMKAAAMEEWRAACSEQFTRRSPETIIANAAYAIAYKIVDETLDGKLDEMIVEKTRAVVSDLTSHTIFRPPSTFDRESSPAWKLLQKVAVEEKDAIGKAVREAVSKIDAYDALRLIQGATVSLQFERES